MRVVKSSLDKFAKMFGLVTNLETSHIFLRKILACRDWYKGFFVNCISDGQDTSLWLDYWLS